MIGDVEAPFPIAPLLCCPEGSGFRKYEYVKALGFGFSSTVSLIRDHQTGDRFACKTVSKAFLAAQDMHSAFDREVRIAKSVDHPSIVKLHEVHDLPDSICLVMEYCSGGTLLQLLERTKHIDELYAAWIAIQLADALVYLHGRNICHRDLKLENVLLDNCFNTKIGDLGFSTVQRPDCLLTTPCGSFVYAAPEILAAVPYDGRKSDIWSLGIALYAMCAGCLPLVGTANDTAVVNDEIPYPLTFSRALVRLLAGMLEKNPAKRLSIQQVAGAEWMTTAKRVLGVGTPLPGLASMGVAKSPSAAPVKPPVMLMRATRTKKPNRVLPIVRQIAIARKTS
jgi:serine/threonine protein kinase